MKTVGYAMLSVALISLIVYGKYKLATMPLSTFVLIAGGLVFVASSPAQTAGENQ